MPSRMFRAMGVLSYLDDGLVAVFRTRGKILLKTLRKALPLRQESSRPSSPLEARATLLPQIVTVKTVLSTKFYLRCDHRLAALKYCYLLYIFLRGVECAYFVTTPPKDGLGLERLM